MGYPPVLITTLCRDQHLQKCIDSLRKNKNAQNTDLYIALDYPLNESHVCGYNKILIFLDHLSGFHSINIIKREVNFGPLKNLQSAIDQIYKTCNFIIISEDDNIFSPNFLDYINQTRIKYDNDNSIFAICGYTYPVEILDIQTESYIKNQTFFTAWGFGIWKEKYYQSMRNQNLIYLKSIVSRSGLNITKSSIKNLYYLMRALANKSAELGWDIYFSLYIINNNMFSINPTISKVRNMGWDGSGVNCNYNEVYCTQNIDSNTTFVLKGDGNYLTKQYSAKLKQYYTISLNQKIFAISSFIVCKLLGIDVYLFLVRLYKKTKRI